MTVRELIAKLQLANPDALIVQRDWSFGDDIVRPVGLVYTSEDGMVVWIDEDQPHPPIWEIKGGFPL